MGAHEHLNQLEFPGMPERRYGPFPSEGEPQASPESYPDSGAHRPDFWGGRLPANAQNPLPSPPSGSYGAVHRVTEPSEEFIPPHRVYSAQRVINPKAVEHQVKHAYPLALRDDPKVWEFTDDDGLPSYNLGDGNHRVNAAQRRGQLLMPAQVRRSQLSEMLDKISP